MGWGCAESPYHGRVLWVRQLGRRALGSLAWGDGKVSRAETGNGNLALVTVGNGNSSQGGVMGRQLC